MISVSGGGRDRETERLSQLEVDSAKAKDVEPTRKAERLAAAAREPHPSPDIPAAALNGSINSPAFLTALVKWHPAVGAFQYLADCYYPASTPPDKRFTQLSEARPKLLGFCIFVDFVVMLAILAALAVIAGRVVWMTLFA